MSLTHTLAWPSPKRLSLQHVKEMLVADLWFYAMIAAYSVAGSLYLLHHGLLDWQSYAIYPQNWFFLFVITMPVIALSFDAIWIVHRFDRRRMLAFRRVFSSKRLSYLVVGLLLLMGLSLFQSVFTAVKTAFPLIQNGFPYDRAHAALDHLIHFNTDPWRLLQPWMGSPVVLQIIELNYNVLWFAISFTTLFFMLTSPKASSQRNRYFVCFVLTWTVIGTLLAGLFLSAGPAYYGLVTGDTGRFADQIAFLSTSNGWGRTTIAYQNYLWTIYSERSLGFGSGISAFPSMHVALITLTALFLAELNRKLALPLAAYVVLVLISSVYLGWHYAIDGYVSAGLTFLIYVAVNKTAAMIETLRLRRMFKAAAGRIDVVPA